MAYYAVNYYNDLYHHGILGMKWGVRRYQNEDGSLTSKGKSRYRDRIAAQLDKTAVARLGTRISYGVKSPIRKIGNAAKAKGVVNKTRELVGRGARRTERQTAKEMHDRLKAQSRTSLGKRIHEQHSVNNQTMANYHDAVMKSSVGKQFVEAVLPVKYMSTPYERLSGRTTSRGARFVDIMVTGGMYGAAKDIAYLARGGKERVNRRYSK